MKLIKSLIILIAFVIVTSYIFLAIYNPLGPTLQRIITLLYVNLFFLLCITYNNTRKKLDAMTHEHLVYETILGSLGYNIDDYALKLDNPKGENTYKIIVTNTKTNETFIVEDKF